MPAAASFSSPATELRRAEIPLREAAREVTRPSGGVVFVAGPLAADLPRLGALIARCWPGVPTLIATGSGVLSEREEIEGQGISGVLFSGGTTLVATALEGEEAHETFVTARAHAGDIVSAIVCADPGRVSSVLDAARASLQGVPVLGGGLAKSGGTATVSVDGDVRVGWLATMLISRVARPRVIHSPGFKVLGAPVRVTAVHQGMATELDGAPALDELSRRTRGLEDRPLVAAIFLEPGDPAAQDALKVGRVRPIRGIDPDRRAIAFVESVEEGQMLALAARDPVAARAHLNAVAREIARENAGSAPRFALYFNCAGRGRAMYGAASVDATILRNQLGAVPIAGVASSVEITTPHAGSPTLQFYTGVLALFSSPS